MNKYYRLLGLRYDAPLSEIKQAYRDLVRVWHPDRFARDERLQKRATEKLIELNEAYRMLRSLMEQSVQNAAQNYPDPIDWSCARKVPRSQPRPASRTRSAGWRWYYSVAGIPIIGLGIIFWLNTKPAPVPSRLVPPPIPTQYAVENARSSAFEQISANSPTDKTFARVRDTNNTSNDTLMQSPADSNSLAPR
jgi:hypothetical protein